MALHRIGVLLSIVSFAWPPVFAAEDTSIDDQVAAASRAIGPALKEAEELTIRGQGKEADARLLGVFPDATRTPAQMLVLGNVLFKAQPKLAYALHRQAAEQLPNHANALLEWAMEQHRAKEYAGAASTYERFSKLQPDYAPALGLAAECAIRTGDVAKAVALWKASEQARRGTLNQLESLVCEVNGQFPNEGKRMDLLRRAEAGEEKAACELMLLDAAWPLDWWNTVPRRSRLDYDQQVVRRGFTKPGAQLRAALCVAECELLENKSNLRATLASGGFLVDEKATLPSDGKALSHLIKLATGNKVFTEAQAKAQFGERILAMARQSHDVEMYNTAAYLAVGTDRLAEIDQEGWDKTSDARFAASRIVGLARQKTFTLSDPLMQRALKEFPEESEIAAVALALAGEDPAAQRPRLIAAMKAEYAKFSSARPGVDLPRPSAYRLRGYFALLERLETK
jgi:hypothetical protein